MNRTTHNKDNRLDRLLRQVVPIENAERGQMLLIMAFAMVGLLVAVGLAVDGGVLFARKAQLDRAADAAALVGVVEYAADGNLTAANTRARQFLGANGIFVNSETTPCSAANWDTNDFCGERPDSSGSLPGTIRYGVEVRWHSEVYFMQLIGFDTIPLKSKATAEYFPLVDIYTSPTAENGLIRVSNLSIFGENSCVKWGDPRTPHDGNTINPAPGTNYDELKGVYTFRLTVPKKFYADYPEGNGYQYLRVELFDPDDGNQIYDGDNEYQVYDENGIPIDPEGYCADQQLRYLDPDDETTYLPDETKDWWQNNLLVNACLIPTVETADLNQVPPDPDGNPYWIIRVDEIRAGSPPTCRNAFSSPPATYANGHFTRTAYRLFYYQQTASGGLQQVDLAYYIGKVDDSQPGPLAGGSYPVDPQIEAQNTDLMWVSPGAEGIELAPTFDYRTDQPVVPGSPLISPAEPSTQVEDCLTAQGYFADPTRKGTDIIKATSCEGDGNFIVDLDTEVPDIFVDPNNGSMDIFLQVIGLDGTSENAFEIWAGPSIADLTAANDPHPAVPSEVNSRNVYYMVNQDDNPHSSAGVSITGLGHLNMNYNSQDPSELPLAYLGPQFSGANMTIQLFDADGGSGPIVFYMDSVPQSDWAACFKESGTDNADQCINYFADLGVSAPPNNGEPTEAPFTIYPFGNTNPGTGNTWVPMAFTLPGEIVPFYGGRLMVHYEGSANDTINWMIVIESRPFLVE